MSFKSQLIIPLTPIKRKRQLIGKSRPISKLCVRLPSLWQRRHRIRASSSSLTITTRMKSATQVMMICGFMILMRLMFSTSYQSTLQCHENHSPIQTSRVVFASQIKTHKMWIDYFDLPAAVGIFFGALSLSRIGNFFHLWNVVFTAESGYDVEFWLENLLMDELSTGNCLLWMRR